MASPVFLEVGDRIADKPDVPGNRSLAHDQAVKMLDNVVRRESYLMAYNDAFLLLGCTLLCVCIAVALLKKPQGASAAGAH